VDARDLLLSLPHPLRPSRRRSHPPPADRQPARGAHDSAPPLPPAGDHLLLRRDGRCRRHLQRRHAHDHPAIAKPAGAGLPCRASCASTLLSYLRWWHCSVSPVADPGRAAAGPVGFASAPAEPTVTRAAPTATAA